MASVAPFNVSDIQLQTFPPGLRGKRILLCTESFGPVNGVSRTTMMLVGHLRKHGAIVSVVAPLNHTEKSIFLPPTTGVTKPVANTGTPNVVRIQGRKLPFNYEISVVNPVLLSSLYKRTFGGPPDLIYLASPASIGFQVMGQLRQLPSEEQVPIICNFQTDLSGYCAVLYPRPLSTLASCCFDSVQGYLYQHPTVRTIFYPSCSVRRYLDKLGVESIKTESLQRGVDTELFSPLQRRNDLRIELDPSGEDIILICVARLAGEKGFEFLARVAGELERRNFKHKLCIVGGNPNKHIVASVKAMFEPQLSRGSVIFAGQKTGTDLAAAFASADIFLHCSVTETFGLVVLESMASGVPVVARDKGGPSDIVCDGQNGYLIPPDDLALFCDRVVSLANDAPTRARFSVAARLQAEEATWEKINNKVAWRMSATLEQRKEELEELDSLSVPGRLSTQSRVLRLLQRIMVKIRLLGCMVVMFALWAVVGVLFVGTQVMLGLGAKFGK